MAANTNCIQQLLERQGYIVLDGGLATQLEQRGLDLSTSRLWSGAALLEHPDTIHAVHAAFFAAGADVATTASYQASPAGLQRHGGLDRAQAAAAIVKSVELARRAADDAVAAGPGRTCLVAGSVGPYGAFLANGAEYTGEYGDCGGEAGLRVFHRPLIELLVEAGCDVIACETIPSGVEVAALLDVLADAAPRTPAWLSVSLRDGAHLADGTPLGEVVAAVQSSPALVAAVGFNCAPASVIGDAIKNVSGLTRLPLLACPNSGEVYNAIDKTWRPGESEEGLLGAAAEQWSELGVRIIGGCCRSTPQDIRAIKTVLESKAKPFNTAAAKDELSGTSHVGLPP